MNTNAAEEHFFDIKSGKTNDRKYQYVTAGEKCKTVGWQDGNFYDFGHHLPDEMGGVWVHPIKVADGFWLGVNGTFEKASGYKTLPYGNAFLYKFGDVECERFQYSPDSAGGIVIAYTFKSTSQKELSLDFVVNLDILPVWFSKESGIEDCQDTAEVKNGCVVAKDTGHNWYGLVAANEKNPEITISKEQMSPHKTKSNGVSVKFSSNISFKGEVTVYYFIAGSYTDQEQLLAEYEKLKNLALLEEKKRRYERIDNRTKLSTKDAEFDNIFKWVKFNTDWLAADCGDFGRALTAGMPEYPWWFGCDNCYSIQGLLAMGEFELAKDTLKLVHDYSKQHNGNGRIVHEITNNGKIANPGNSQETAHYITAVYNYWRWTGDTHTVNEVYDYCVLGIDWLLNTMDKDGDLLPSGYGIIEIKGLNAELIDTAVYTCQALFNMAEMAEFFGNDSSLYSDTARKLQEKINSELWDSQLEIFVDAVGTPSEIIGSIEILKADENNHGNITKEYNTYLDSLKEKMSALPQDKDVPVVINKNWVILTPMETLLATKEHAEKALCKMYTPEYIGDYGTYLAGFMHKNTMTISTGVHAVAEGRNGRSNQALDLLKRMCKTFSLVLPNSISEMSPDYGCFAQAWTAYAMLVPVVECFAGIKPQLQKNTVIIEPCIPDEWERMELTNVRIGEYYLNLKYDMGTFDITVSEGCPYEIKILEE